MMNKNKKLWGMLILTAGLAASGFSILTLSEIRIENVENGVLDESFVQAYTSLRAGQQIESETELNAAVAHDVDNLRRSERFSYVRAVVEQAGEKFTLVYKVASRLRLRQIEITGAEGVGNRKIKKELELALGDYVDQALVGEKVRKVEEYCRKHKYPAATITWDLKADGKTGAADLLLKVNEGEKLRVKRISFEGESFAGDSVYRRMIPNIFPSRKSSDRFDPWELRKIMQQKKTWWITPWGGAYKPETKEADIAAIRKFYQDRGFLDVKVDGPELKQLGDGKLELIYHVQESVKYQIGSIGFDGNTLYERAELEKQVKLKSGAVASRAAIDDAASSVNHYYGNRGYIHNDVQPVISTDPATKIASIRFSVREGELANINEIDIRGNEKTRDEVMRRELAVYPGELFHQQKVETSESRLKNLGYFETVNSSYAPAAEGTNAYDLAFKVKEKAMGSFLVGAGFSSVDDLVVFADLSHGNFDIRRWPPVGDGQKMKVRVQAGTKRNDVEVSYIEPWFMDRKLALGEDLYYRNNGYYSDQFDLQTLGSRTSLTKPLGTFTRGTVSYSLEQFRVDNVTAPAAADIWNDAGTWLKSTVGTSISFDTRDQFFIPTKGNYSSTGVEVSGGPLGGDEDIYTLELKSSEFWPVLKDHVFNIKGELRTVDSYGSSSRVPVFDRLFLGGPRNLRGFKYRYVSPRDPKNDNEPLGGLSSWYCTAEYTVPLWSKIRAAVFYDIGAVSEDTFDFFGADINSDFGIGMRIDLPMFPLRLDYAIPHIMDKNNDGADGRFSFLLGYSF